MSSIINIISQDDSIHHSFIHELENQFPGVRFSKKFIANSNTDIVPSRNPILDNIEKGMAIIRLESLPFPSKTDLGLIAVIKSESGVHFACYVNENNDENYSFLKEIDIKDSTGKVYLVGAGQSNKRHLTLRALELIKSADIIFYDSLIDTSILELSKGEKVFVGKRANKHFKDQKDINLLLFEAALKYKTIVRVKGGDPMIFGHAGEEIAYLESKLIKVETVAGISSPLGAAAMANLPLTLRNISNSVSFISAHEKSKIEVPNTDTIVYFMGATNLPNIARALKKNDRPGSTPLTLFYNIGSKEQAIYHETVNSVIEGEKEYKAPLLIVAGEVGDRKQWYKAFNYKPKILFTGTTISKYAHLGYVYHQPMIEIATLRDFTDVDRVISDLHSFRWICFTSLYAVENFFNRLYFLGKDVRSLSGIQIASIGKVTSAKLKNYGIIPDLQAKEESSEGLIKVFKEKSITSTKILIPRSNLAMDYLPDQLSALNNIVTKLVVYENKMPEVRKKVEIENFDQVIFTSPSGVDNFMKAYGKLPEKPEIISRGKETQKRINYYS